MKTIVTLQYGNRAYFEASQAHLEAYASFHRYQLVVSRGEVFSDNRDPRWSKVPAIIRALENSERVLYMDADAVIVKKHRNMTPLETLLGGKAMLLGEDSPLWANTGIMYFTPDALPLLREWNEVPVYDPETANKWPVDELGFNRHIFPKYSEIISLPKRKDRTDSDFLHGSFFYHFANGSQEEKAAKLDKFLNG